MLQDDNSFAFQSACCSSLRLCNVTVLFELRPAAASHWTGNMLARQQLAGRTTGRRAAVSNFISSSVCQSALHSGLSSVSAMDFCLPCVADSEPLVAHNLLSDAAGSVSFLSRPCAREARAATRGKADMHNSVRRSAANVALQRRRNEQPFRDWLQSEYLWEEQLQLSGPAV